MRTKFRFLLIHLLSLMILFPPIIAQSIGDEVKLAKQIRTRGLFDETDFNNDTSAKRSTLMRVRLNAGFQPAENISAFLQLQDSRVYGSEPNTLSSLQNIDLHQAYLRIDNFWTDELAFKVGRMELAYGGQRLVGSVGWHNVGRAFDGSMLSYKANGKLVLDVFGTKLIQQTEPDNADSYFGGIYATVQPVKAHSLDFYILGELNRKQSFENEDDLRRITIGTHDKGKFGAIDYETELAAQLGQRNDVGNKKRRDISAFMVTGSLGYTLDTPYLW